MWCRIGKVLMLVLAVTMLLSVTYVVHAVYCNGVYINYTVALGYYVHDVNGSTVLSFGVNFYPGVCTNYAMFGWGLNITGAFINITPSMAVYLKNASIDIQHFQDIGIFIINGNATVHTLTRDVLSFTVYRNDRAIQTALLEHRFDQYWEKILEHKVTIVALWLPNVTLPIEAIYVNGSNWNGYRVTDPAYVLNPLVESPAWYWDENAKVLIIRIPMHSRYVVTIMFGRVQVTPTAKIKIDRVILSATKTTVETGQGVLFTISVVAEGVTNATVEYRLTCVGPETITDSGTITINNGIGVTTTTIIFNTAGMYTCYVTVENVTSPPVYIKVIEATRPSVTMSMLVIAALLAAFTLVVAILIMIMIRGREIYGKSGKEVYV